MRCGEAQKASMERGHRILSFTIIVRLQAAYLLGQVGEMSLKGSCVGGMGSAGWLSVLRVTVGSRSFELRSQ